MIMEVMGIPPDHVLEQATRRKLFFDEDTLDPLMTENGRGQVRIPGGKSLQGILNSDSASFLDFVERCLEWDPEERMDPLEALQH